MYPGTMRRLAAIGLAAAALLAAPHEASAKGFAAASVCGPDDWLPGAGVMRGYREREWTRPGPALDRALRRAARGLRANPATELTPLEAAPPARVDEVYTPARENDPAPPIVAAGAVATLLAALAMRRARKRPAASPR
jgi:hypothetical protein